MKEIAVIHLKEHHPIKQVCLYDFQSLRYSLLDICDDNTRAPKFTSQNPHTLMALDNGVLPIQLCTAAKNKFLKCHLHFFLHTLPSAILKFRHMPNTVPVISSLSLWERQTVGAGSLAGVPFPIRAKSRPQECGKSHVSYWHREMSTLQASLNALQSDYSFFLLW